MSVERMNKAGNHIVLLTAVVIMAWCPILRGQHLQVVDLGTLGGPMAGAFGRTANQFVVGYSARPDAGFHAFLWDGVMHDLAPLAGDTLSHAFGVNSSGSAVGVSYSLGGLTTSAMLWQGGAANDAGIFAPRGINEAGTVVGYVSSGVSGLGWVDRACVWKNGNLTSLATLGGSCAYAYDVNGSDQIIGMSYTAGESARRACLWVSGQAVDLGTLGGTNSQAYALNTAGQIVGVSDTATGSPHAFLYQLSGAGQVGSRTDLGELGGGYSYAYGVNSAGEVVGTSNSRAFFWKNGHLSDLNSRLPAGSGWVLNSAIAINDKGQIVGLGTYQGWPRAYLLSFVAADLDHDGDVDHDDFALFQACFSGPAVDYTGDCAKADFDHDLDVDQADFGIFQRCFSGANKPADPSCAS